jgi:hypothetical protein
MDEQEIAYLKAAFDAAIKNSPDAMAAANVLTPIYLKIVEKFRETPTPDVHSPESACATQ